MAYCIAYGERRPVPHVVFVTRSERNRANPVGWMVRQSRALPCMIATADSDRTTVSPACRNGPACSRITPAMSSPGKSTGVLIGIRSNVRPSTTTVRGAGPAGLIGPMVPAASVWSAVASGWRRPYAPGPMPPRSPLRLGALAAALALVVLAVVHPAINPSTARGAGALPACRYDDIMTEPRGYDDWSTTLVDTILRVPKSYAPPDLVPVSQAGIAGHGKVRAVMIEDLAEMTTAAAAAGNEIGVQSAYRSYDDQVATFAHWVSVDGYAGALRVSARPGHSEHQLGLAIDFRSEPTDATLSGSWGQTPAGKWM